MLIRLHAQIPIRFVPREPREYITSIPFLINQAISMNVVVSGTGIPARLELVNPAHKSISFGATRVNTTSSKIIKIVNRSKRELCIELHLSTLSIKQPFLDITPTRPFTLRPRETQEVQVVFAPSSRVEKFTEHVTAVYAGVTSQLFAIHGKAEGHEISFDTENINFGTVSEGSHRTKRLQLLNTGDFPVSFAWIDDSLGRFFSVRPLRGTVLAHSDQVFEVTFQPTNLEGEVQQDNITLTMSGLPPLQLSCTVRATISSMLAFH